MDESLDVSPQASRAERGTASASGPACAGPTKVNVIFSLTVLPHEQSLLRRGRRLVGSDADARDLVQETLERALRTFHAFRPGTAVWAWLRTIMNSVWIDGWRRRQAAAKVTSLPVVEMASPEVEPSPREGVEEEFLERLPHAIARLPPIFREVLELRLQANHSYGAIAKQLGIPSRTVGTRILRARKQLRTILEEEVAEAGARLAPRPDLRRSAERCAPAGYPANDVGRLMPAMSGAVAGAVTGAVAEKKASWHRARV
jgi:RNA polymerase sigma-70 factor (ECF subfamily)